MENELYDFYTNDETTWVCKVCLKTAKEEKKMRELLNEMREMHEKTRLEAKKERDEALKDGKEVREMVNQMMELYKRESEINEKEREEAEREREEIRRERKEAEKDRSKVAEIMKLMSEKIEDLAQCVENKINEKIKLIEKDIMAKVNEEVKQEVEKFRRRKNLVIYGLAESEERDEKEKHKSDEMLIKKLIRELNIEDIRFKSMRHGKIRLQNKVGPIKIELEEELDKFKILKRAASIRRTDTEKFKKIIITNHHSHDL